MFAIRRESNAVPYADNTRQTRSTERKWLILKDKSVVTGLGDDAFHRGADLKPFLAGSAGFTSAPRSS
jgi:hypothetical protein